MKKKTATDYTNPTVNLAINKSRVKKYGKKESIPTYYLKKGQEFQIELYNPTQGKVLAEINLNGKSNGGLILRAGERIFLDRYLDSNNKFLFDTYEVNDDETTKRAIELNGDLKVDFFYETQLLCDYWRWPVTYPTYPTYDNRYWDLNNITIETNTSVGLGTTTPSQKLEVNGTTNINNQLTTFSSNSIETGIVDKGSVSEQKLEYGTGTFNTFSFHSVEYKLLPLSQKKVTASEYYKKYCGNCGAKCKTKFCSNCGAKQ